MMMYGSLQAKLMETAHNSLIHKYGISIFSEIFVYVSKPINNDNQLIWRLKSIIRFDMSMFFLHRKQGFLIFGCISYVIDSCMEEVIVDVIYGTQLDLNGGDCTPHALQRIYFLI